MGLERLLYIFPSKFCHIGDSISYSPNLESGTLTKGLASPVRLSGSLYTPLLSLFLPSPSLVSLLFMHLPSRYLDSGSQRQSPDRQAGSAPAESRKA